MITAPTPSPSVPGALPILTQIVQLGVTYPAMTTPALKAIDLTIHRGERLALIGQSGSGKSTLARAIAGLLPKGSQISGAINWPDGPPKPGRDFGYVFQDASASLNPVLSIGAQLIEVIRAHEPMPAKAAQERALELLTQVQLPQPRAALARYPHQFSGGQKQRCAIALAIAARPSILIADEATSALDMLVQAEIVALIDGLVRQMGMTLIFITHDIALAAGLADHIAVLNHGQLVEQGPSRTLIAAPQQDYTRELIAAHIDLSAPILILDRDREPAAYFEQANAVPKVL